jgi:hypothetical protein
MYAVWDETGEAVQGSSVKAGWVRINEYEGRTKGKDKSRGLKRQHCSAASPWRPAAQAEIREKNRKRRKSKPKKKEKNVPNSPPNPIVIHPHSMYVVLWGGPGMPSLRKEEVRADTKCWE